MIDYFSLLKSSCRKEEESGSGRSGGGSGSVLDDLSLEFAHAFHLAHAHCLYQNMKYSFTINLCITSYSSTLWLIIISLNERRARRRRESESERVSRKGKVRLNGQHSQVHLLLSGVEWVRSSKRGKGQEKLDFLMEMTNI